MPRDEATLFDIVQATRLIIEFKRGMNRSAFLNDVKTQSAVLHQLMVMGEAVKRLSQNFRRRHTKIPWMLIAGMCDKLIHAYDIIDLDEIWKTVDEDVPNLLSSLKPLLTEGGR